MYQLEAYRGIFIQSKESNEEFITACITELQPVCNSPIKRVIPNAGNGIRMYFEDEKTVNTVLSRRELVVSGQRYDMCPLVTHLTIHTVIPNTEHDVAKDLSDKMKHSLGPVLKINELPVSKEYLSVGSGNWRVSIEIPEFKAIKEFQDRRKFKKKNESNEKSIEFFYTEDGLKLSFFCPKCNKDGHISQRCKMLFKRKIKPTTNKPSVKNIRSNTSFQKDAVASTSTASTNNIRGQTSRETIEQPREACSTSMDKPSKRKSQTVQNTLSASSCSQPVITSPTRNIHSSVPVNIESQNPGRRNYVIGEIKILPNSRIEECIRKAGGTCRLSQPQLENFFNHVKGKKDVSRILKLYKKTHKISEKALKEQLTEIVGLYHISKLPETKEDKTLIKWLEGLVVIFNKKRR
ncbi:hypothetical protein X975_20033, partial [Stegodyphus mimosarum]